MDGSSPSGFTSSSYIGMDAWDCSMGTTTEDNNDGDTDTNTDSGERDVKEIEVKSLLDVFDNAETVGEFFSFLWYNPQVMVIWFHWW